MLDKFICHLRGVRSILSLLFYSLMDPKILLANTVNTDQMPQYVASDLGLHCLLSKKQIISFKRRPNFRRAILVGSLWTKGGKKHTGVPSHLNFFTYQYLLFLFPPAH